MIVYNRKEGRALGEVTKFLVYNARKRQAGGDRAAAYFERTECVAGVQDVRFQELMPDVLHWLGITRIDRLVSMSNMKYDAMVRSGHRDRRARADPGRPASRRTPGSRWRPRRRPATTRRSCRPPTELAAAKGRALTDYEAGMSAPSQRVRPRRSPGCARPRRSGRAAALVLAAGERGALRALRGRRRPARRRRRLRGRDDARQLPGPRHALSQPLAAFRRRAAATAGRRCARSSRIVDAGRDRAHPLRSRGRSACCSMPARAMPGAIASRRPARCSPLRGAGGGEPRAVRAPARSRPIARSRCGPMPRRWRRSTRAPWRARFR